jgi:Uma2 family endonuclease
MDLTWSVVMTISGNRKLLSIIDSPLEDFEPMPEGDKQRRNLSYATEALKLWFEQLPDIYVSGNLFIRYEENGTEKRVAPDIFVVFGTSNEDRVSYTVWEEDGKVPDFVLELTSKGTVTKDRKQNPLIYKSLGVKEYFQYDPSGASLKPTSLQGVRLMSGKYKPIPVLTLPDGTLSLHSETLGLDLHLFPDKSFRFYNPISRQILRSHAEAEHARYQAELERSYEQQARREAEAAQKQAEAIADQERLIALQERNEKLQERNEKLQERNEKLQERNKNEKLAAYLRSLGINPDDIS